jgi:succinate dehydrogenase/fumarate reductase-like Fe-S protein
MLFARMIGQLVIIKPYINQPNTPKLNKEYIGKDMPDRSRDFHECIACGTKDAVVKKAEK